MRSMPIALRQASSSSQKKLSASRRRCSGSAAIAYAGRLDSGPHPGMSSMKKQVTNIKTGPVRPSVGLGQWRGSRVED